MNVVIFLLVSFAVFQTNAVPQRFVGHFRSPARQYYAIPHQSGDFNLTHGEVDAQDDDSVEESMANLLYQNAFIQIANDDFLDNPILSDDADAMDDDDDSTGEDVDEVEDENNNSQDEIDGELEEEDAVNEPPSVSNQTISSNEETTDSPDSIDNTENPMQMELETTNNSSVSTEGSDQVITPFVHPIFRPSNEWPLNENKNRPQKGGKPIRKRIRGPNYRPIRRRVLYRRGPNRRVPNRRVPNRRVPNRRVPNGGVPNKRIANKSKVGIPPRTPATHNFNKLLSSCVSCQCGVITTRLDSGGNVAAINEFPWLALITYDNAIQCAGTLISNQYVLTAAHCVQGFDSKLLQIGFLEHNVAGSSETVLATRTVSQMYGLESYVAKPTKDDIALIKLSEPIQFSTTTVRPICLPTKRMELLGKTATIAGWKAPTKSEYAESLEIIQKTRVPILSNKQCLLVGMNITKDMLCTGRLLQGEIDSCQGDSGGPLMVVARKRYYLAGLVSWGDGCDEPLKPGVYTKVSSHLPWIRKITAKSCTCV